MDDCIIAIERLLGDQWSVSLRDERGQHNATIRQTLDDARATAAEWHEALGYPVREMIRR